MISNNPDFMDYIGSLKTDSVPSTEKEISAACVAALNKAGLRQKGKRTKHWGHILLIAAAVTVGAAVTAEASGYDIGELFRGYFEHGGPIIDSSGASSALTQSQVKVLDQSGAALNISAANNGTTIAVKAVTGDPSDAFILFEITAPKGTKLDRNDYTFERDDDNSQMELTEKGGGKIISNQSWGGSWDYTTMKDSEPADNKIQLVMNLRFGGIDLRGKELHLDLKDITVPDPSRKAEYLPILKGEWKLTIPLDYTSANKELTVHKITRFQQPVNPKAPAKVGNEGSATTYQCIVETVNLSSFSAVVQFTSQGIETHGERDMLPVPLSLTATMKNGTKLEVPYHGGGSDNGTQATFNWNFDRPVEVAEIASLTLGDLTIPVS